jgi:hypothetical protein
LRSFAAKVRATVENDRERLSLSSSILCGEERGGELGGISNLLIFSECR